MGAAAAVDDAAASMSAVKAAAVVAAPLTIAFRVVLSIVVGELSGLS